MAQACLLRFHNTELSRARMSLLDWTKDTPTPLLPEVTGLLLLPEPALVTTVVFVGVCVVVTVPVVLVTVLVLAGVVREIEVVLGVVPADDEAADLVLELDLLAVPVVEVEVGGGLATPFLETGDTEVEAETVAFDPAGDLEEPWLSLAFLLCEPPPPPPPPPPPMPPDPALGVGRGPSSRARFLATLLPVFAILFLTLLPVNPTVRGLSQASVVVLVEGIVVPFVGNTPSLGTELCWSCRPLVTAWSHGWGALPFDILLEADVAMNLPPEMLQDTGDNLNTSSGTGRTTNTSNTSN